MRSLACSIIVLFVPLLELAIHSVSGDVSYPFCTSDLAWSCSSKQCSVDNVTSNVDVWNNTLNATGSNGTQLFSPFFESLQGSFSCIISNVSSVLMIMGTFQDTSGCTFDIFFDLQPNPNKSETGTSFDKTTNLNTTVSTSSWFMNLWFNLTSNNNPSPNSLCFLIKPQFSLPANFTQQLVNTSEQQVASTWLSFGYNSSNSTPISSLSNYAQNETVTINSINGTSENVTNYVIYFVNTTQTYSLRYSYVIGSTSIKSLKSVTTTTLVTTTQSQYEYNFNLNFPSGSDYNIYTTMGQDYYASNSNGTMPSASSDSNGIWIAFLVWSVVLICTIAGCFLAFILWRRYKVGSMFRFRRLQFSSGPGTGSYTESANRLEAGNDMYSL